MKSLIVLLLLPLVLGCTKNVKSGKREIPNFRILLPDSTTYFDTKDIPQDTPVVLFFFGPYCEHSRAQIEEIIEDMDLLKDIHFYLVTPEPFDDMRRFYLNYKLKDYKNIIVGYDYGNFFRKYYKAEGYPMLAVFDKEGKMHDLFLSNVYGRQIWHSAEG